MEANENELVESHSTATDTPRRERNVSSHIQTPCLSFQAPAGIRAMSSTIQPTEATIRSDSTRWSEWITPGYGQRGKMKRKTWFLAKS